MCCCRGQTLVKLCKASASARLRLRRRTRKEADLLQRALDIHVVLYRQVAACKACEPVRLSSSVIRRPSSAGTGREAAAELFKGKAFTASIQP